jgi:hypothetical protein
MSESTLDQQIRHALDLDEGTMWPWWALGCQVSGRTRRNQMPCPEQEAVWRCEVIGPHTRHRWSQHLITHERAGNGYGCRIIGDGVAFGKRLYPWSRLPGGVAYDPTPYDPMRDHPFVGDGSYCQGWNAPSVRSGSAGTMTLTTGCGYPRDLHPLESTDEPA